MSQAEGFHTQVKYVQLNPICMKRYVIKTVERRGENKAAPQPLCFQKHG